ncbi:MAG: OmpA family protein [Reinekea sp.]
MSEQQALLDVSAQTTKQHRQQLDTVNEQQKDFFESVQHLHTQINTLQQAQSEMTSVEEQIQQHLEQSRTAMATNLQELNGTREMVKAQRENLERAQKVIQNQQKKLEASQIKIKTHLQALAQSQAIIKNQQLALEESQSLIKNQQRALAKTLEQSGQLTDSTRQVLNQLMQKFGTDDRFSLIESKNTVRLSMPLDTLFRPKEAALDISAILWLQPLAEILISHPDVDVQVIGHTDNRPMRRALSNQYPTNWELSSARASRIVSELIKYGVPPKQLTASGKAAYVPVQLGQTIEAWKANRRIEIVIR